VTLVGGGSRSGKSRYALDRARALGSRIAFVATAEAYDSEMRDRIARHQAERGPEFTTFEEPRELTSLLNRIDGQFPVIVVDCLTLWLTNRMLAGLDAEDLTAPRRSEVIYVTNEVGCGIVPDNELARRFRDEQGRLNQRVAAAADNVIWMAFGLPLALKGRA
jgi:adenosylcobinamide kinase/adenosylcobinamide-phosphate guanylyltransferase